MNTFKARLVSPKNTITFTRVISFRAKDFSGSFGVMAQAQKQITYLDSGLALFRSLDKGEEVIRYIALPGGIFIFDKNILTICARHFLVGSNPEEVSDFIDEKIEQEEKELYGFRKMATELEDKMLKRIWRLQRDKEL